MPIKEIAKEMCYKAASVVLKKASAANTTKSKAPVDRWTGGRRWRVPCVFGEPAGWLCGCNYSNHADEADDAHCVMCGVLKMAPHERGSFEQIRAPLAAEHF